MLTSCINVEVMFALSAIRPESTSYLTPLYPYFLSLLYTTCAHLIPQDLVPVLSRIKLALWPIYSFGLSPPDHSELTPEETGPIKVTTSLLIELKKRSVFAFSLATEHLIPNKVNVQAFLQAFIPDQARSITGPKTEAERAFFALIPTTSSSDVPVKTSATTRAGQPSQVHHLAPLNANPIVQQDTVPVLPIYGKYLVIAAYCASYNSAKSDMRMFGRGPLSSTGRTRENGAAGYEGGGKAGSKAGQGLKKPKWNSKAGKIPQYLLGPRSFPLERLLAIFQAILFEHGYDYYAGLYHDTPGDQLSSDEDAQDSIFSDANQPAGRLNFELDQEAARATKRRRARERARDKERLRDWEEAVVEISQSVGLLSLVSLFPKCLMALLFL